MAESLRDIFVRKTQQALLLAVALIFLVAPLSVLFLSKMSFSVQLLPRMVFLLFATLPGFIGLATFIASQRERFEKQKESIEKLVPAGSNVPAQFSTSERVQEFQPSFVSWLVASVLVTGVFLVAAVVSLFFDLKTAAPATGLVYAGYGAYVSTLWFLLARLNANALSPRFLTNSAVKAAIGMMLGFVAAVTLDLFSGTTTPSSNALFFLIGMFHDWAFAYLRRKATEVFGVNQAAATEVPLVTIEGVDEAAADLLKELGIASVQHLAYSDPVELSARSLYPLERVLDWIDQALLALYFRDKTPQAHDVGVRGVMEFVVMYMHASGKHGPGDPQQAYAQESFKLLSQKVGIDLNALYLLAEGTYNDETVRFLYKLWQQDRGAGGSQLVAGEQTGVPPAEQRLSPTQPAAGNA